MQKKKYTSIIIIPCYNEAVRFNIEYYQKFAEKESTKLIIFVDDGSKDNTTAIIDQVITHNENTVKLVLGLNQGKAEAVRQGVLYALSNFDCDFIGFADADLSTNLEEFSSFEKSFENIPSTDIIIGSRIQMMGKLIQRNLWRHYFSRAVATLICNVLDEAIYDTQCGVKSFRPDVAEKLFREPFISKWIFDVEILARYKVIYGTEIFRQKIIEQPVNSWIEKSGSKIRLYYLPGILLDLLKIKKKYSL